MVARRQQILSDPRAVALTPVAAPIADPTSGEPDMYGVRLEDVSWQAVRE